MKKEQLEHEILRYLEENPGTTLNRIVNFLSDEKHVLSYVPARNTILDLIDQEIIEDRQEGNSFHRLFVNDRNLFYKIEKQVKEIENISNSRHKALSGFFGKRSTSHDWIKALDIKNELDDYFLFMLRILLVEISDKIRSEKHSQMLYDKIVKLMIKLDHHMSHIPKYRKYLIHRDALLIEQRVKPYLRKMGIETQLTDDLIALSNNFERNILS